MVVTKAVIPAAGRGTRLAPITRLIPKELLCVGAIPLIEWALRQCVEAGIREVAIVVSPHKPLLKDYVKAIALECEITWIEQPSPAGSGDALRRCQDFVGDAPSVIYMPDEWCSEAALKSLMSAYDRGVGLLLTWVRPDWAIYFPGVGRLQTQTTERDRIYTITELLPKVATPFPAAPGGSLKGVGIGIVPPQFFEHLNQRWHQHDPSQDFDDVPTWQHFAKQGQLWGYQAEGLIIDVGNPLGLAAAHQYWLAQQKS